MENNVVGYRFKPTNEELINHYLKNKILGNSWLVDGAISEINIYGYEPELLPSLSKIKSNDPYWYFFYRKVYTSAKKKDMKRTTPSGFWKITAPDKIIKDKGGKGVDIGIRKMLAYHEGKTSNKGFRPWKMYEYHITSLPLDQSTYVICRVKYKGNDGDSLYGNNSNEPSLSMVTDSNTVRGINTVPEVEQQGQEDGMFVDDLLIPLNEEGDLSPHVGFNPDMFLGNNNNNYYPEMQSQNPHDDDFWTRLLNLNEGNLEVILQGYNNDHRPKEPLTGIIVDYSSDSDAESISATSYRGTSSQGDSDGSPNKLFHSSVDAILSLKKESCKDMQTSAATFINGKTRGSRFTRRTMPSKQELKEGTSIAIDASMGKKSSSMVKTEKKGWFITEEAMDKRKRKNPPYIYLVNIIISFILLVAVTGNIISIY